MENLASTLGTAASDGIGQAVAEVRVKADDAKAGVANGVNGAATAVSRASQDLLKGSLEERTLGVIANGFGDSSDAIRDLNLGQIVQRASHAARTNPALFLGGAALSGLAGSRYVKASGRRPTQKLSNNATQQVEGPSQSQSMIFGLLAIAPGAALGGLLPHSRIEDTALGKIKDQISTDFKRKFLEGNDAPTPAGTSTSATEDEKSEPGANLAASRNLPLAQGVGGYLATDRGPKPKCRVPRDSECRQLKAWVD